MIVLRIDHNCFVVNKKQKKILDDSSEKLYRQNNDRDIAVLQQFFIENPLRLPPHEKKIFFQNERIINKEKKLRWDSPNSFSF